jgi:peptidoglycan/xylan/chitin deacetylase (PgdA/CDA1 family)
VSAIAKHVVKRLVAHGLFRSGWWGVALGRWARRDTTIVLTYHRVLEKWEPALDCSQPGMVVTVPTFERQLSFLTRHFDIVPLGALLDGVVPGQSRRPRCVVTFDDGWRDNYDLALPILHERRLPATIFLTTDLIGTDRAFWHTELIHVLLHGELSRFLGAVTSLVAFPAVVQDALRRCAGAGRVARAAAVDSLIEAIKAACDEPMILSLVDTLIRAAGLVRPLFPGRRFFLDWTQVREMAAGGFEIGSHGCSHRIMTRLSPADASEELVRSKAEIERRVGCRVAHFAFPNEDANETLIALAARAGYRTACVASVAARPGRSDIRLLRRAGMHEGACGAGRAYDDALLGLCLLRGPKSEAA